MTKLKKVAVFPLLILTMIMSVACASERVEENVAAPAQVEETVEQPKQEAVAETTQTESNATDNAEQEQTETDLRFEVDEWVNILGSIVPAKDKKQDFMGSKWGDTIDQVKENMGKEPDAMRGDSQMIYVNPIFDYEAGIYLGFTNLGFCYANIVLKEKASDTQTKILNAMNKAAVQLYGEAKENVNGRIVYETEKSHIEIRKTNEDIEIYVDDVSYIDDPAREAFKGVSYTVEW